MKLRSLGPGMKHCSVIEPDTGHATDIVFFVLVRPALGPAFGGVGLSEGRNPFDPAKQVAGAILSLTGGNVQSACGVTLNTCRIDDHPARYGHLFWPGGPLMPPDQQVRLAIMARAHLRAGGILGAVDPALIPLAHTGLLSGLEVTASAPVLGVLQEQLADISPVSNDSHARGVIWSTGSKFSLLNLLSKTTSDTLTPRERPRLNRKFLSYRPNFGR